MRSKLIQITARFGRRACRHNHAQLAMVIDKSERFIQHEILILHEFDERPLAAEYNAKRCRHECRPLHDLFDDTVMLRDFLGRELRQLELDRDSNGIKITEAYAYKFLLAVFPSAPTARTGHAVEIQRLLIAALRHQSARRAKTSVCGPGVVTSGPFSPMYTSISVRTPTSPAM